MANEAIPVSPVAVAQATPAPQALETQTALPANLPAADSAPVESAPVPVAAVVAEPAKPSEPKSILGELLAQPDEVKPPVEPVAEAIVEPVAPEAVKYEAFKLPEAVTLDDAEVGKYTEILGKHQVPQEAAQALVDLYVAERTRDAEAQRAQWERTTNEWMRQVREDPDIGKNRYETTLSHANAILTRYGQVMGSEREQGLRQAFNLTGIGNHPEMIRFVDWAAGFTTEQGRPVAANVPTRPQPQSRAARRYSNSLGNGAA